MGKLRHGECWCRFKVSAELEGDTRTFLKPRALLKSLGNSAPFGMENTYCKAGWLGFRGRQDNSQAPVLCFLTYLITWGRGKESISDQRVCRVKEGVVDTPQSHLCLAR